MTIQGKNDVNKAHTVHLSIQAALVGLPIGVIGVAGFLHVS